MSFKRSFVLLRIFLSLLIFSFPFLILEPSVYCSTSTSQTSFIGLNQFQLTPTSYNFFHNQYGSGTFRYQRIYNSSGEKINELSCPSSSYNVYTTSINSVGSMVGDLTMEYVTNDFNDLFPGKTHLKDMPSVIALGISYSLGVDNCEVLQLIRSIRIFNSVTSDTLNDAESLNVYSWQISNDRLWIFFHRPIKTVRYLHIYFSFYVIGSASSYTCMTPSSFRIDYPDSDFDKSGVTYFLNEVRFYSLYQALINSYYGGSGSDISGDLNGVLDYLEYIRVWIQEDWPSFVSQDKATQSLVLNISNYLLNLMNLFNGDYVSGSPDPDSIMGLLTSIRESLLSLSDDILFNEPISMGYPKYYQQLSDNTWNSYSSSTGKVGAHGVKYSFSRTLTSDVAFGNMIRLSVNYNYVNIDSSTLKCFFGGTPHQMMECSLVSIVPSVLEGYKTDFYFVLPTQFTIPYHPQQVYYVGFTYNEGANFQVTTDLIGSVSFVKFGSEFYFNNANQQNIISLLNTISNQLNDVQIDISTLTESLNEFNSVTSQLSSYETSYKADLDSGMSQINLSDYTLGFSTLPIATFTSFVSNCYNSIPYLIRQLIFLPLIFGVVGAFLRRRGGD